MKKEITVPTMGESIQDVTIASFLKDSGSQVTEGEEIVELETEKVNQVLYAPASGVVNWSVKIGDTVPIGANLGFIDTEAKGKKPKEPVKEKREVEKKEALPKEDEKKEPAPKQTETKKEKGGARLTQEAFIASLREEEPVQLKEPPPIVEKPAQEKTELVEKSGETRRKMTKIRKVIASRLVDALHQAAMLTTFNEVDMSAVIDLRTRYKDSFVEKHNVKLGFMSFFVKAVVDALKEFPDFNSYIDKDEIVTRHDYDIGIAVSTERGLVVPVVRRCDELSFAQIEQAIADFAKKARAGRLAIEDLQGGGFTITNGGVYGSLLSTPILNPPQVGILGMHKIMNRPVVVKDQIVIRPMMYLALSYDHRMVDGKEAVSFLIRVKDVLEDPSRLMFIDI